MNICLNAIFIAVTTTTTRMTRYFGAPSMMPFTHRFLSSHHPCFPPFRIPSSSRISISHPPSYLQTSCSHGPHCCEPHISCPRETSPRRLCGSEREPPISEVSQILDQVFMSLMKMSYHRKMLCLRASSLCLPASSL
jgi:hypothetical protein